MQNFSSDTKVTDATTQTASESQVPTSPRKDKTSPDNMYTTRDVAKILGVDEKSIRNWRNEKLFGCIILPEDWRTAWAHPD